MHEQAPTWADAAASRYLLAVDGTPTVPAWLAHTSPERRTGLLGTTSWSGALWIEPCTSVHTIGMQYPIDVAFVDRSGQVLATTAMPPGRLGRPRLRSRAVVELGAGALNALGISRGSRLALLPGRDSPGDPGPATAW